MVVADIIAQLKHLPPDTPVLVYGPLDALVDVKLVKHTKVIKVRGTKYSFEGDERDTDDTDTLQPIHAVALIGDANYQATSRKEKKK